MRAACSLGLLVALGCTERLPPRARPEPPPRGTVPWGALPQAPDPMLLPGDEAYRTGRLGPRAIEAPPEDVVVDDRLLARGRDRYGIFCAPCHGQKGEGHATSPVGPALSGQQWGVVFAAISLGKEKMPAFADTIGLADRWAIVAHLRSLSVVD